jgi:tRNA-specific 2-thiouridylase
MSGGVDSSVAAALLCDQGYRVVGVMLRLWAEGDTGVNRCCAADAIASAQSVARRLGIPFWVIDARNEFRGLVVETMLRQYAMGRTPNPCFACNAHVRFGLLLNKAVAVGASYLATGHYARIRRAADGRWELLRAIDRNKDQSYVLYRLGQAQLRRALFPVGEYSKTEVRQLASRLGLSVASRPDSVDLCFVADGNLSRFLEQYLPAGTATPGAIVDVSGRQVGTHAGLPLYTVGQRRGLGIALGEPAYVLERDAASNTLVVGPREMLGSQVVHVGDCSYVAGAAPAGPMCLTAKLRYRAPDAAAVFTPLAGGRARLEFEQAQPAITPGQGAVLYDGDIVVGGGLIE